VKLMDTAAVDVAIIGAGPYGLSLASYLRQRGVEHRIFGAPMHAWASMSPGMFLKSFGFATSLKTPQPHFTLPEYCRDRGLEDFEPIAIATYAKYGQWVQEQLVPEVEATSVTELRRQGDGFALVLATGERLAARRVVVATGLTYFERIPATYASLPNELASHTAQHGDFSRFSGMDVTVVGGGQSALQAAALLHEHGARVRMVVRRGVWFSSQYDPHRPLREKLLYPQSVVGPGRENWVMEHFPMVMHYVPEAKRVPFTRRHLGPFGAWWLRDRVEGQFSILEDAVVTAAGERDGKVALRVRQGTADTSEIVTDHVIAGTGYEVDVDRIPFVQPELAAEIARVERAPNLTRHFESSVRGLYFVGPAAAFSFGPLFRFVAGADYAVPLLARRLAWTSAALPVWRRALPVALTPLVNPAAPASPVAPAPAEVTALQAAEARASNG
jgi:cation diffusion facilitator CzcD-associated flavoprotein CzcO